MRVWQEDVELLLAVGIDLLPLAPIANVDQAQLPGIIRRMESGVEAEVTDDGDAGKFWTATYILMGLRYNKTLNAQLLQGVRRMKESVTYQAILDEGREEGREVGREEGQLREARRLVLRVAARRLGQAPATAQASLDAINDLETLEGLVDRVFEVETWDELLPDAV